MFCNKTKATWKAAFKLLRDNPEKMKDLKSSNDYKKKCTKAIEIFKSEEYHKFLAYCMAESNGFQGSSEFYWNQAEKLTKMRISFLEALEGDFTDCILMARYRLKSNYQ